MSRALWRIAFGAGLIAVAWTSLLPYEQLPQATALSDKVIHLLSYAALGAFAVLSSLRLPIAVLVVVSFGLVLEIAQGMSGYRSFEWADLVADAAGAVLGASVITVVRRGRVRRANPRVR